MGKVRILDDLVPFPRNRGGHQIYPAIFFTKDVSISIPPLLGNMGDAY